MHNQADFAYFLRRYYSIFLAYSALRFSYSTLLRYAYSQSCFAFTKSRSKRTSEAKSTPFIEENLLLVWFCLVALSNRFC